MTYVQGGSFDAIGADIAGVFGIGHTRTLAWGLTAGMVDVADCFVETIDFMRRVATRRPRGGSPPIGESNGSRCAGTPSRRLCWRPGTGR